MRRLALLAIRLYQRYLSPHKGFDCAYRVHTGRAGCSGLGARVIRRFGVRSGLVLLRQRMRRCSDVHRWAHPRPRRPLAPQRGDCDCDVGGLDCDGANNFCSCCDCADCDWSRRKTRPMARSRPLKGWAPPAPGVSATPPKARPARPSSSETPR